MQRLRFGVSVCRGYRSTIPKVRYSEHNAIRVRHIVFRIADRNHVGLPYIRVTRAPTVKLQLSR